MNPEFNESLQIILKEMCNRVGADSESIDFSSPDWYTKYEWTMQECKQFEDWMADFVYKNAKARREITNYSYKNKKRAEKVAREFTFMYGWRYCERE